MDSNAVDFMVYFAKCPPQKNLKLAVSDLRGILQNVCLNGDVNVLLLINCYVGNSTTEHHNKSCK